MASTFNCTLYGTCCQLNLLTFEVGNVSIHLVNVILSIAVLGASIWIMIKLVVNISKLSTVDERVYLVNEERDVKKPTLLPFYYGYLFVAAGWLLLQSVSLAMIRETAGVVFSHILQDAHAFMDTAIVVFTFFPSAHNRYILITLVICISLACVRATLTFIYTISTPCVYCTIYFPAPQMFYFYAFSVALNTIFLFLIKFNCKIKPRETVQWWLIYLIMIYFFGALSILIVYEFKIDFGICLVNLMGLIYVFSYSPFLYYTAYSDSQYLVENEEENIAPTGFVHNDFIEQRKPRVVEVDDFDRRGYLEQAIEDFADKDEIIDLLAENPSITWIDIRNIKFGRRIGCGGSAEVREGIWNGGSVAVKTLFHNEHSTLRVFFREVKVMSLLHSPNILLFMGICVDSENRYIITELMRRGCVFNIIHSEKHHSDLTGERIKRILIHSARGILYLHSHNPPILHRDLKSHNLLVDLSFT